MSQQNFFVLKEAGIYERAGRFSDALLLLANTMSSAKKVGLENIYEMNINRLLIKVKNRAREFYSTMQIAAIFEHENNPKSYARQNGNDNQNLKPLISMTTISGRIGRVEKTVSSLLNQSYEPHSINLYISSEPYLIDEGIDPNHSVLKDIGAMGVNIYQVSNIGPYRKQVPLICQLYSGSASPRTPFITIDDDVIYPSDIVERLMMEIDSSEAVVAHRGREIGFQSGGLSSYKSFQPPRACSSLLNIGTGKNGIAYRLGYFPDCPDNFVGHILAPTADDIWCKWATSYYCIPTVILEPAAAYDPTLDFAESEPSDKNGLFHKYNAKGTNDDAMKNLETYFVNKGAGLAALFGSDLNG